VTIASSDIQTLLLRNLAWPLTPAIKIQVQILSPLLSPESSPWSSPESRVQVLYCPCQTCRSGAARSVAKLGAIPWWIVTGVTDSRTKVVAVVGSTGLTSDVTGRAIGINGTIGGDAIAQPDECSSNTPSERRGSTKSGSDGLSFKECNTHCVQKLVMFIDSDIQLNFILWTKETGY